MPHARRDQGLTFAMGFGIIISTHTPHARRDGKPNYFLNSLQKFQLTRLMRGVTTEECNQDSRQENFNSHASCEA